jgi:predicted RNase H-like nuclease (RuvC/YqgF family)
MTSVQTHAITSQPFVAARGILNAVDKAIDPLCRVEFLAIPPRIVQIAINCLGLVGTGSGAIATSVIGAAPLPRIVRGRISVWNKDAWALSSELAGRIGRLSVATIPIAGSRTLRRLDAAASTSARLTRENEQLQAAIAAQDVINAQHRETIKGLHEQLWALQSDHQQVKTLVSAREALEKHAVEQEKTQQRLAEEKREQEQQVAQLRAKTAGLQEQVEQLSQQILSLTSRTKEKESAASEAEQMLVSSQRHLETSAQAAQSARTLETQVEALQEQIERLMLQRASLEAVSEQTAKQIESLITPDQ